MMPIGRNKIGYIARSRAAKVIAKISVDVSANTQIAQLLSGTGIHQSGIGDLGKSRYPNQEKK